MSGSDSLKPLPADITAWLEDAASDLTAHLQHRPTAKTVFQHLLRQIYVELLAEQVRDKDARLTAARLLTGGDRRAKSAQPAWSMPGTDSDLAANLSRFVRSPGVRGGTALLELFEPIVALQPSWSGDRLVLSQRSRNKRRSAGSYFTPDWVVERVLDWAQEALQNGDLNAEQEAPPAFYDPACGSGRFLVAALERLADTGAAGLGGVRRGARAAEAAGELLVGVQGRDIDPLATDLCQAALAAQYALHAGKLPAQLSIATGDSLLAARMPFGQPRGKIAGGLIITGNPPFVNAIGRQGKPANTGAYRSRYESVRGAADLAAFFLAHSAEIAGADGVVALVLPRAILNSAAAERLRANLPHGLRPALIWAPDEPFVFAGAAVYFCVVVLGRAEDCRFSTDPRAAADSFVTGRIYSANWWRELCRVRFGPVAPAQAGSVRLGDIFEVRAGLTAGEAYELRRFVTDSADGPGLKLLTTGLIDPGETLWGRQTCRFLKADYRYPRVAPAAEELAGLARRIERARRPKIIVAGLARQLECYLDLQGEYLGSVSTYAITHPADSVPLLRSLQEELCAPRSAEAVFRELGAHALGGGNTTIRKSFLLDYRLPDRGNSWG